MRLYGSQAGWYYFVNDHLGTPRKIVGSSGVVVWQAAYLPFGKAQVLAGSTIVNNFRFPGQYYDAETELHYNWNRYYMPAKGRYLTPDPIGLLGGINLYAYVGGNPTNLSDPFGLYESPWYLQWVPGQHFYDLGMTALENGEYGAAGAYFSAMVAEQVLFLATLGEGSSIKVSSKCMPKGAFKPRGIWDPVIGGYIEDAAGYTIQGTQNLIGDTMRRTITGFGTDKPGRFSELIKDLSQHAIDSGVGKLHIELKNVVKKSLLNPQRWTDEGFEILNITDDSITVIKDLSK